MSPELVLYLIDVSSGFSLLFLILGISALVISITTIKCLTDIPEDEWEGEKGKKIRTSVFRTFFISIMLIIFCILIPSQKTLYAMASVHYLKDSTISEKVLKAIDLKLDDYIKEGKKINGRQ